jgi:hypothetical protein
MSTSKALLILFVTVTLAGCSHELTKKQALAVAMTLPGFSSSTGNDPRPSNLRIDNIYREGGSRATVQATFSYPMTDATPDKNCTARKGSDLEDCSLYMRMVRYDGGWDIDKEELALRQSNDESLRRFNDETAKQHKRLEALRQSNEQLQQEITNLASH